MKNLYNNIFQVFLDLNKHKHKKYGDVSNETKSALAIEAY